MDLNTWCNQLHNVPLVFPITQQSDNFTPSINGFNFPQPVLGSTVVSFTAFDPHAPAQYIQQWSASVQKSVGHDTTLEIGYHGERGFHLQRRDLINNDLPGPGTLQPRRPYPTATFLPGTVIPANVASTGLTFPVSTVNMLEDTARSWYDAGYINLRRRYSKGLTPAGELHVLKEPEQCAGFPLADVRIGGSAEQPRSRCGERAWRVTCGIALSSARYTTFPRSATASHEGADARTGGYPLCIRCRADFLSPSPFTVTPPTRGR